MKNIIKIGISIVGIILVINFIYNLDDLILGFINYMKFNTTENYFYLKQLPLLDLIFLFIGSFLKLIVGLFLLIKPSLFTNIYIPNAIESDEGKWTLKLILSFTYCLAIYLIVFGIIECTEDIVRLFLSPPKNRESFGFSLISVIPQCIRIIIGYILYKSFKEKLYSKSISPK